MNIAINQQREQIKKYFNLLVAEFIKDPKHKDIKIIFQNFPGKTLKLGHTLQIKNGGGTNIPGSERTTSYPIPYQYKYEIQFLAKGYKNEDELRGVVVHEFTHLYLFSTIGKHDHDDRFYSQMERLERLIKGAEVLVDSNDIVTDPEKLAEFNQLSELLSQSLDLDDLEKNYQI
ncbi:2422_t:CDS:2, partial [Ambispora gerdemannii]